jgi:dihydroorotase
MRILIKNGLVVDPSSKTKKHLNIIVNKERVEKLTSSGISRADDFDEVIDATNLVVAPGLIDIHVHLRDPGFKYKETIKTGSQSAVAGGFTSIACMPNTKPINDNPKITDYIISEAKKSLLVNVLPIGAITKASKSVKLAMIESNIQSGCIGVSDDGFPVTNPILLFEAMEIAKKLSVPVISHCEDLSLSLNGVANEGNFSKKYSLKGIPNVSEELGILRDISIAEATNAHLHICHVTTKKSVEIIREAKSRGVRVTAEATPHHFTLSEDDIKDCDPNYKMNPPLRFREDVEAIILGLKDNTIDVIATDHAPHSEKEKSLGFKKAPFGIIGLETALPLSLDLVHKKALSLSDLIYKMSTRPSEIININRGSLKKGSIADIVIFDMNAKNKIDKSTMYSKSKNTPFHGFNLKGRVVRTIVGGRTVFNSSLKSH